MADETKKSEERNNRLKYKAVDDQAYIGRPEKGKDQIGTKYKATDYARRPN